MAPENESALTWPLPRHTVTVAGRTLPTELVAVAAVYAAAGLWLLWQMWGLVPAVPQLLPGLFSSQNLVYAFTYLAVFVLATVLFLVAALLAVAGLLLRADPLGRGLSAVLVATLLAGLGALQLGSDGWFVLVLVVAAACSATLFLSPWCREAFATSPRRGDQPGFVVLSRTLLVGYVALLAFEVVVMVPGLRFVTSLGVNFVLGALVSAAACVLGWRAQQVLRGAPTERARLLASAAAAVALLGSWLAGGQFPWVPAFVLAGIVAPLWLAPGAGDWFSGADRPASAGD